MPNPLDDEFPPVYTEGMKTYSTAKDWVVLGLLVGMATMSTLLSGCSAAGQSTDEQVLSSPCDPNDIFAPGPPELQDAISQAAEQWQAAIGRPVCVEKGGLPFHLQSGLRTQDGIEACGYTFQYYFREDGSWASNVSIEIRVVDEADCYSYRETVLHEMGHALGHRNDHTSDGLMALYADGTDWISQDAIDYVCEHTFCDL
jgi:hypothetical protein